jgi:energy-coupling factor transport system substrate-specific component
MEIQNPFKPEMMENNLKQPRACLSYAIYAVTMFIGIISFLYPFLLPAVIQKTPIGEARSNETPFMLTLLLILCIMVLIYEVQGAAINTKLIALLGILVAINSTLRFIEVAIPAPAGFTPIFTLIILTGYVFGGRFGFLMGAMTLFVSAIITGGIGPWLPSQMFAAGWVGMSASLLLPINQRLNLIDTKGEVFVLAMFGFFWGLAYVFFGGWLMEQL